MAIHRESMYFVSYETRIPLSERGHTTYNPYDRSDKDSLAPEKEKSRHDSTPEIAYGCNMLGRMGECVLRQQIEKDKDSKPIMRLTCEGMEPTHSKAHADMIENMCRTVHSFIRNSHTK